MILAGAIPATAINLWKCHPTRDRPLLDFDIALLLVPATLGGTTPGVLLNVLFPEWLGAGQHPAGGAAHVHGAKDAAQRE